MPWRRTWLHDIRNGAGRRAVRTAHRAIAELSAAGLVVASRGNRAKVAAG